MIPFKPTVLTLSYQSIRRFGSCYRNLGQEKIRCTIPQGLSPVFRAVWGFQLPCTIRYVRSKEDQKIKDIAPVNRRLGQIVTMSEMLMLRKVQLMRPQMFAWESVAGFNKSVNALLSLQTCEGGNCEGTFGTAPRKAEISMVPVITMDPHTIFSEPSSSCQPHKPTCLTQTWAPQWSSWSG